MNSIEEYYNRTEKINFPHNNVKEFIQLEHRVGKAIELGCGAGRDTIYLIKNNWNVIAIDREEVKDRIEKRLQQEDMKKFRFQKQDFENIKLEECDLLVANYSIPFCNKNEFEHLWNKIENSIHSGGYFVGNLFGIYDEWKIKKDRMVFLNRQQVLKLLNNFEIIKFQEIEKDEKTGLGIMKHWHIFDIIARKNR